MLPPIRVNDANKNNNQRQSGSFGGYTLLLLLFSTEFLSYLKLDSTFYKLNANLKITV